MDTIKNLQNEVIHLKSDKPKSNVSKSVNIGNNNNLLEMTHSRQIKRQFDFVKQENQRLKSLNETMKNSTRNDFGKLMEVNSYYKMLNEHLQEHIENLKNDLNKETSKSVNLENKMNMMQKESVNIKNMISNFKNEVKDIQKVQTSRFEVNNPSFNVESKNYYLYLFEIKINMYYYYNIYLIIFNSIIINTKIIFILNIQFKKNRRVKTKHQLVYDILYI